jgi:alkylation response protein AidB-like acyl-CoA dehydrogenase
MTARLFNGAEYLVCEATKDEVFTPECFNDEQKQMGAMIEQFVSKEVAPLQEQIEGQNFPVSLDLLRMCGDLGVLMMDVPSEYGGLELDKVSSMHVSEKMAWSGSFFVTWGVTSSLGTLPLVYYGTEDQKKRYFPKIMTAEWVCAYCLTEPDAGSDALGAKTTARLSSDGKHYLLNGTKQFISNGAMADLFTVFAKIDGEHFSAFLVEKGFGGITIGPEEKKLGLKGSSTTQVIFDQVKVPVENLLGEIGKGHKIAFNVLNLGRLKVAAGTVGAAKQALAGGVSYANLRKQFRTPISHFGAIKEKIADMAAAVFVSESVLYRVTGLIDARLATIPKDTPNYYEKYQLGIEEYATECAIAKVFCSEVLSHVADEVVQIHGGYGFVQDYPAERYYRDERINRIFEGTNEINRMLITTMILRKALSGDINLALETEKARERFGGNQGGQACQSSTCFQPEKSLTANLKHVFFLLLGAASSTYQEKIRNEQEVLLALADVAINIFAIESAVMRAEKIVPGISETKGAAVKAMVEVFAFNAGEKSRFFLKKAANYTGCSHFHAIVSGIGAVSGYDVPDLLSAKRTLADAVIETEKYPLP